MLVFILMFGVLKCGVLCLKCIVLVDVLVF